VSNRINAQQEKWNMTTLFFGQARQWFAARCLSLIRLCCLVTLILCIPTSTAAELEELSVTDADGEYSLRIVEVLNVPADYVRKVITDYKHAYRIDPTITKVEVLPTDRDKVVRVRNISEQCVGPFCFEIAWAGDIVETKDGDIQVKTIPELSNFASGSAIWRIRPQGEHAWVFYESRLKPAFFIPPVIGDVIIEKHIKEGALDIFKNIEHQAITMLARHQPEYLKRLSRKRG
jgi:hypothetical protein